MYQIKIPKYFINKERVFNKLRIILVYLQIKIYLVINFVRWIPFYKNILMVKMFKTKQQ